MGISNAEKQRRHKEKKWAEVLEMPKIPCECGCGVMIEPLTKAFTPARYVHGHNSRGYNPNRERTQFKKGQKPWNDGIKAPSISAGQKGKKKSPESIAKRTATRLAKNDGVYQKARGWKHKPETIQNMRIANAANAKHGADNPMYGKKPSQAVIAKMKAALPRGEKHANWHGGVDKAGYGHEFTHELKRTIKYRDKFTCQRCGINQNDLRYYMHIHHLDHDKLNNSPDNLVCACAKCNQWARKHPDDPFINPEIWERTHPKS